MKRLTINLILLTATILVSGCASTGITPSQQSALRELEIFALDTAVAAGTQATSGGDVDTKPLIINSLNEGSSVLHKLIDAQPAPGAAPAKVEAALTTTAKAKVVRRTVAPKVANAVRKAIDKGAPADKAVKAAADGLQQGAAKLSAEAP